MEDKIDVVISGVSARIPDCDNITDFMEKVYNKVSMTGVNNWWNKGYDHVPYYSGTVKRGRCYDNYVFNINNMQAQVQVPEIPKMLEMAFEAIIDAGVHPKSLNGANCGVYTNTESSDLLETMLNTGRTRTITGTAQGFSSNRFSFGLNLHGHSVGVSGSNGVMFYLMKRAIKDIQEGRLDSCIVGTIDFVHEPLPSIDYLSMNMLAEDGECRPFDENAHGTVRSEGGVVLFLQRASMAKRHRAIPVYFDFKFLGDYTLDYLSHDAEAMIKMLKKFYAECDIDPRTVQYVEADGSGIKSWDELELKVLTKVFTENRTDDLLIGSVMSNVGRSEASAGFTSLAKAILSFKKNVIPPTRNHSTPNSKSPSLASGKIKVVTEETELKGDLIAVNSLPFNSGLGHGLLRKPPQKTKEESKIDYYLLLLSSRTEEGLKNVMERAMKTPLTPDFADLLNGVFYLQQYGHYSRGVMVVHESDKKCIVENTGHADSVKKKPLWFVFSGMGAQKNGMGNPLMQVPVFAEVIDRCDAVLAPLGVDIKHILTSTDETIFDNILNSFVGTTAMQIGLIEILRKMGIEADKYVGHSLGEQACAYADGCLSLEQTILCSWSRGKASLEAELIPGMMAAVGLGYQDIKDRLPESIDVACHNSNASCTLSGPAEDVKEFVRKLKAEEVFAKEVNVSNIAYHSRYVVPAGPRLRSSLKKIIPAEKECERSEKWISTSVPKSDWSLDTAKKSCAEYFTNNLLSPVLFEEAFAELPADAVVLEIAPQSLLLPILKRAFPPSVKSMSLTSRVVAKDPGFVNFLSSVGKLYLLGFEPDPRALYPSISYPVASDTPDLASFVTWEHSFEFNFRSMLRNPEDLEMVKLSYERKEDITLVKLKEFKHVFEGHVLQSRPTIPLSFYLKEVWNLLVPRGRYKKEFEEVTPHFKDIYVQSVVWMDQLPEDVTLCIQLSPASGMFEVGLVYRKEKNKKLSADVIVRGFAQIYENDFEKDKWICENLPTGPIQKSLTADDLRQVYQSKGYDLDTDYANNVTELHVHDKVSRGKLVWKKNWERLIDGVIKAAMLIDVDDASVYCPVAIESLIIQPLEFKQMDYDTEVEFLLDRHQNVLLAPEGIQMKGMIFKAPPTQNRRANDVMECREFVPFFTAKFQNEEDFITAAVEILLDCCPRNNKSSYNINICDSANAPKEKGLLNTFRNTVQNHYPSMIKLSLNDEAAMKYDFCGINILMTSERGLKAGFIQQAEDLTSTFILYYTDKMTDSVKIPDFAEVLQHVEVVGSLRYVLLKKRCHPSKKNVCKLVESDWLSTLHEVRTSSKDATVTLVWDKRADINPHEIIQDMKATGNLNNSIRCVFIKDKQAPTFSEKSPFYGEQLQFGFAVNVLQNGVWGTLKKIRLEETKPENLSDIIRLSKIKREDIDIHFISLNTQKKRTNNYEDDFYILEYSGITKDKKNVMGLAQYRPKESDSEIFIDPKLIWEIPHGVSMEDAATLPLYYGMANYSLVMCATAFEVESALIHNGTSLHGLACIDVAHHAQLEVFTTVFNPEDRKILKKHFPQLEDKNIIDASAEHFNLRLMLLTGSRGVDFVISDLPEKYISNSWECVARYGSLIDFNEHNMSANCKLPMYHFLKCTTYYSCLKTSLFSLSDWRKKELWGLVQNSFGSRGIVKLPRRVFNVHQLDAVARALNKEGGCQKILLSMKTANEGASKNPTLSKSINLCNSDDTYFILSPSIGKSLSLADWILVRGGRKIVLAVSNHVGSSKKLNDFISRYKADFLIFSTEKFTAGPETVQLIHKIKKFGPVSVLFNVFMDESLAAHIASLLLGSCQIINISHARDSGVSDGAVTIKDTARRLSIICEGDTYLRLLDQALISHPEPKTNSVYTLRKTCTGNETKKQVICTEEFLPKSFKDLEELGSNVEPPPKKDGVCAAFKEVSCTAPLHKYTRNVFPVYLITSSHEKKFERLRKRLMYPLYLSKFSEEIPSASVAAKHLFVALETIQPKGPCEIVVDTWKIGIAAELVKLLKEKGRKTSLIVLPISPKRLRSLFSNTEELEDLILQNVLQISTEDYQRLYAELDLKAKLEEISRKQNLTLDQDLIRAGVTVFTKQIELFLSTSLPNRFIECPVLIAEIAGAALNEIDYHKVSKELVTVHRSSATSYDGLLADPSLVKLINQRAMFFWPNEKIIAVY